MTINYFENMYKKYFKVLYLFSLRIVNNTLAAEDIVQDVFTECWSIRNTIDTSFPIKAYLYKLTYHQSINYLNRASNKNHIALSKTSLQLDDVLLSALTIEDTFFSREIGDQINYCINSLPEKCRKVFLMSRHDNLKNREIAETLNISIKTVEKHIAKALQEIRIHLIKTGYLLIILINWLSNFLPPPHLTLFNTYRKYTPKSIRN